MTAYESDLHILDVLLRMAKAAGARSPIKHDDFVKQCGITGEEAEYFLQRYSKNNGGFINLFMGGFFVDFEQDITNAQRRILDGLAEKKRDLLHRRLRAWAPLWSLVLAVIVFVCSLIWNFAAQRGLEKRLTDVEHRLSLTEQRIMLTK